ncbi:MAG: hypothetical protein KDB22_26540 [Planctomycetales bacterium]|nr:hypothetical protein [Planctomycetales bacterium]
MSIGQLALGRDGLRVAGGSVEPLVSSEQLLAALEGECIERFRPLLPVGYDTVATAYRMAAGTITARDLSEHYTSGLSSFHDEFVPQLKSRLSWLSGEEWTLSDLDDFIAFAAGSDVDLMSHLIEAVAAREQVVAYPGDWYGFSVGSTHAENILWNEDATDRLACLCVPSVRNGHLTQEMLNFLASGSACLLNLNLFPTLAVAERSTVARQLRPLLNKSVLSISFSRGFSMTASQLGVFLLHRDHPFVRRFGEQWNWFTYFYNSLAAQTFLHLDWTNLQSVDNSRRAWVDAWLASHNLPQIDSGSYYVKSFSLRGLVPEELQPLTRNGLVRLCFKPPQT